MKTLRVVSIVIAALVIAVVVGASHIAGNMLNYVTINASTYHNGNKTLVTVDGEYDGWLAIGPEPVKNGYLEVVFTSPHKRPIIDHLSPNPWYTDWSEFIQLPVNKTTHTEIWYATVREIRHGRALLTSSSVPVTVWGRQFNGWVGD